MDSLFVTIADQLTLHGIPEKVDELRQKLRNDRRLVSRSAKDGLQLLQIVADTCQVSIFVVTSLLQPQYVLHFVPKQKSDKTGTKFYVIFAAHL